MDELHDEATFRRPSTTGSQPAPDFRFAGPARVGELTGDFQK